MSIASDLAAARAHIRAIIGAINPGAGYAVTIRDADGTRQNNPLKNVPSALPRGLVYSSEWQIRVGPTFGHGRVISVVNTEIWFDLATNDTGTGEAWESLLGAVVAAIYAATAPARTRVTFVDGGQIKGEKTDTDRAVLQIPMQIEVTFTRP